MKLKNMLPSTRQLTINDPFGNPTDWVLTLRSSDNSEFVKLKQQLTAKLLRDSKSVDLPEAEQYNTKMLASCVLGWQGLEDDDGQPIPWSVEKTEELLGNPALSYMKEQLEGYVLARTNFFRRDEAAAG